MSQKKVLSREKLARAAYVHDAQIQEIGRSLAQLNEVLTKSMYAIEALAQAAGKKVDDLFLEGLYIVERKRDEEKAKHAAAKEAAQPKPTEEKTA